MSVETFEAPKSAADVLTVTEKAAAHFKLQIERNADANAIRISMKESGCTGFKYVIDEVGSGEEGDLALDLKNGLILYIDASYAAALRGTVVDYQTQGLNQILVLENPNVKDACGCGESFSV
jgi:iron-sulfur cluster assembly accessory protein